MSDNRSDLILISTDRAFVRRVTDLRPARSTLQVLPRWPSGGTPAAGDVWVDTETAPGHWPEQVTGRLIAFHAPGTLPRGAASGLVIPKTCSDSMLEVLWAGIASVRPAVAEPAAPAHTLPGWLAEFQEFDVGVLAERCTQRLPEACGYSEGAVYLYDARSDVLRLVADATTQIRLPRILGGEEHPSHPFIRIAKGLPVAGAGLSGECAESRIVPLCAEDGLVGLLYVRSPAGAGLEPEPRAAVLKFAARALRQAQKYGHARAEARLDCKTGLYNDRWAFETLEAEAQRAQRYGASLAVLLLDVDKLKPINDQLGHHAGDLLLRHVADCVRSALRQVDSAARLGGDEFLVILPETDLAGAEQAARRIEAALAAEAIEIAGRRVRPSASIGVAAISGTAGEGAAPGGRGFTSGAQLIESADAAMYRAKRERRAQPAA